MASMAGNPPWRWQAVKAASVLSADGFPRVDKLMSVCPWHRDLAPVGTECLRYCVGRVLIEPPPPGS